MCCPVSNVKARTANHLSHELSIILQVHCEPMGHSGAGRLTPGQYLAVDRLGRALMVAAVEGRRLVFVLGRDSSVVGDGGGSAGVSSAGRSEEAARRQDRSMGGALTVSSPVDAHSPGVITLALVALDTGHENPAFVALELEYDDDESDADEEEDDDEDEDGGSPTLPKSTPRFPAGIPHPTVAAVSAGNGTRESSITAPGLAAVPEPSPGPAREHRRADDAAVSGAEPWRTPADQQAKNDGAAQISSREVPLPRGRRKVVSVYELDLGINSVRRRWRGPAPPGAASLLSVPAGKAGPGGWLVLGEDMLLY